MIVILVALFPPAVIMGCGMVAAGLSALVKVDVDKSHEGSELLELSRRPTSATRA